MRSILTAGLLVASTLAHAGEVSVAVAANFVEPLKVVGDAFTTATGHTLKVSPGATGRFYQQITSGAPFEVLLAADDETPKKLVAEGHAVTGSAFTYAIGRLVLWSAQPGFVDADGAVLASGKVKHVAIANPKTAPYGAAAMEVLKARGLLDAVTPKLVTAESIAQAYQFAFTGNAEVAFVARSQLKRGAGSSWLVPASLHGEIRQDAVLLKTGEKNPAAKALLDFLKSPEAAKTIEAFGYARR